MSLEKDTNELRDLFSNLDLNKIKLLNEEVVDEDDVKEVAQTCPYCGEVFNSAGQGRNPHRCKDRYIALTNQDKEEK